MNPLLPPPSLMIKSQIMSQSLLLGQSHGLNYWSMAMNKQQQVINMAQSQSQSQAMVNNQPLTVNRPNFSVNPNSVNPNNYYGHNWNGITMFPGGNNRVYNVQKRRDGSCSACYKPPALNMLQSKNRKFYLKNKYGNRYAPYAPRNTSSFIIRAKKSGGIANSVSPCLVTPSVLPSPMLSPSVEVLGNMVKEEWGVDVYGSMEGLVRLRSDGIHELEPFDEDEGGLCKSDGEEHVETEKRLDNDLSQLEIKCPNDGGRFDYNNDLENRVGDKNRHIAQLEEENLTVKERLFLMEREFGDLKRRLDSLERRDMVVGEDGNGEVEENESGRDSGTHGSGAATCGEARENRLAAEDVCMQDMVRNEAAGNEINNANEGKLDEAKENNHTHRQEIKDEVKKEYARITSITGNPDVVGN
ncbi:unnamed protein product [Eruca vesicaria subsp. sativa]|uniref:PRLI-interacting factor A n=1 Tax=Eruca vesicaria subsp. sativa TaxID=29727 RepID=A0ABC8KCT6_ERUVS|nr:unnamed protein product [Eruca vesicaria subsp. sativa]